MSRQIGGALFFIDFKIGVGRKSPNQFGKTRILVRGFHIGRRDNERGTGFINQNRVYLVDNSKMMRALDDFVGTSGHIIAKVVKTKFIIGAVGNIALIGLGSRNWTKVSQTMVGVGSVAIFRIVNNGREIPLTRKNTTNRQTKKMINRPHPAGVTTGQIIIDGDQVSALPS